MPGGGEPASTDGPVDTAAKVRLAVSRMKPPEEERQYDPSLVQQATEYRALRTFLDEHK